MKKLTNEQTQQIFDFTQKKFVPYYDLQCELVDHIACEIEQQWQTDPNIPFEKALQNIYQSFGIFGFTQLVETQQAKLTSTYIKLIGKEILKFATWPKAIITLGLYVVFQFLFTLLQKNGIQIGSVNSLRAFAFFGILFSLIYTTIIGRKNKKEAKKWLLNSVKQQVCWSIFYLLYFLPIPLYFFRGMIGEVVYLALSSVLITLTIWCIFGVVYPQIDNKLQQMKLQLA